MTLTMFVLAMLPIHLFVVLNPEKAKKTAENLLKPENNVPVAAFHFLIALLVLSNTGFNIKWQWESTLAILGVLMFLKGIDHLFFPELVQKFAKKVLSYSIQAIGFFAILLDLALIYVDTKLI